MKKPQASLVYSSKDLFEPTLKALEDELISAAARARQTYPAFRWSVSEAVLETDDTEVFWKLTGWNPHYEEEMAEWRKSNPPTVTPSQAVAAIILHKVAIGGITEEEARAELAHLLK